MEVTGLTRRVSVRQPSDAGDARRQAGQAAESARLDPERSARLATITAEMASNLLKHAAKGGDILINALVPASGSGAVELIAIDRGPGMRRVAAAMEDHHSSAGTLGLGLGSIRRHASHFEIHSVPERGTAVLARVHADGAVPGSPGFDLGVVTVPKDGEMVSGDSWAFTVKPDGLQVLVVDGLGHGLLASEAASAAIRAYRQTSGPPVEVLRALHPALRGTRGATVGVADVDARARRVTYGGIGNIAAAVFSPAGARRLVSLNGTVGREPVSYQQYQAEWDPGATLILHSDGLMTQWRLDYLPGLATKDPSLIAAVLFRDFARELDDVTVLVARESPPEGNGRS
jgi:anti-sigma regulatory factor (Ser/Thr protein kinase)